MRFIASILASVILILLAIGLIMLASTSSVQGASHYDSPFYYLKRQLVWFFISLLVIMITARIDYHKWNLFALPLVSICLFFLVLVLIPHIGTTVKGSSRWLRIGFIGFQPSELAKIGSIVFLAWWMTRVRRRASDLKYGLLIPLSILGLMLGLIFIEPDFGTTLLIGMVGMIMLFMGGTRFSYLSVTSLLGLGGFLIAISFDEERTRRIIAFLSPEKYAQNEAYQLLNSKYAFVLGGGSGVGLGQSLQKHFYLPEAHTDFILAIIGEELGFAGSCGILVLFMLFFMCGLWISLKARDVFGRLLGLGITLMVSLQAMINIGVVTGCLPTKGLALPFISFGGTSMVVTMAMIGILLNIAWHIEVQTDTVSRVIKNRHQRL
jgi:cell division protein FtsW